MSAVEFDDCCFQIAIKWRRRDALPVRKVTDIACCAVHAHRRDQSSPGALGRMRAIAGVAWYKRPVQRNSSLLPKENCRGVGPRASAYATDLPQVPSSQKLLWNGTIVASFIGSSGT